MNFCYDPNFIVSLTSKTGAMSLITYTIAYYIEQKP